MNRPIKFKAFDRELKRMRTVLGIDWRLGTLLVRDGKEVMVQLLLHEVDLVEFTGLLDSKGKEIYEGDILIVDDGGEYFPHELNEKTDEWEATGKYQIVWSKDGACFTIEAIKGTMPYEGEVSPFYDYAQLEIIGNIYEHPNLLQ